VIPERTDRQRQLNQDVTSAILKAEHCPTVQAWTAVLELERALSTEAETELERDIATEGVASALQRIKELEK
jgi:hypothetical protein